MPSAAKLKSVDLILTSQCNLRCGYCYQNDKKSGEMSWETMRTALDRLLASEAPTIRVGFWGGEPLLEFPLLKQAVAYVEQKLAPERTIEYSISTNGLLLTDDIIEFLACHKFDVQLSFDGVPSMQDFRRKNSFDALDTLLDRMCAHASGHFTRSLHIAITLTPDTIEFLPDSIAYFLTKRVSEVAVAPVNSHASDWQVGDIDRLDRTMKAVFETSLAHFHETGEMPIALFAGRGSESRARKRESILMCGAPYGRGIAVDVNGETHGCITFAGSYQRFRSSWLREKIDSMAMGSIDGENFEAGLERYPEANRKTGMFHAKENKYSSYGKCAECEYLDRCSICPMSIGNIPGNSGPDRMPDFACAFMKTTHSYRDRFPRSLREGELTPDMHALFAVLGNNASLSSSTRSGADSRSSALTGLLDFFTNAATVSDRA